MMQGETVEGISIGRRGLVSSKSHDFDFLGTMKTTLGQLVKALD